MPQGTNTYEVRLTQAGRDQLIYTEEAVVWHRDSHPTPERTVLGFGVETTLLNDLERQEDPKVRVEPSFRGRRKTSTTRQQRVPPRGPPPPVGSPAAPPTSSRSGPTDRLLPRASAWNDSERTARTSMRG